MVDIFICHASIACKLSTNKPAGGHVARIVPPLPAKRTAYPFILDEWICGITILNIAHSTASSHLLATLGFFEFCRSVLHTFLGFLLIAVRDVLFFTSTFRATNCMVSSLVSSYDGSFSHGRITAVRSLRGRGVKSARVIPYVRIRHAICRGCELNRSM